MRRPFRSFLLCLAITATPAVVRAGADQPWNEVSYESGGQTFAGLVLAAGIAVAIHLIAKGEFLGVLRDIAKGLSFVASMYLLVFLLLGCVIAVALLLQAVGVEKSTSGFIALPLGIVVAFKLISVYEAWRSRKPPAEP